jgi:hypothetical protein
MAPERRLGAPGTCHKPYWRKSGLSEKWGDATRDLKLDPDQERDKVITVLRSLTKTKGITEVTADCTMNVISLLLFSRPRNVRHFCMDVVAQETV